MHCLVWTTLRPCINRLFYITCICVLCFSIQPWLRIINLLFWNVMTNWNVWYEKDQFNDGERNNHNRTRSTSPSSTRPATQDQEKKTQLWPSLSLWILVHQKGEFRSHLLTFWPLTPWASTPPIIHYGLSQSSFPPFIRLRNTRSQLLPRRDSKYFHPQRTIERPNKLLLEYQTIRLLWVRLVMLRNTWGWIQLDQKS